MNLKEMSLAEFKEFASTHFIGNFHESINYALIKAEEGYEYEFISYGADEVVAAALILYKKIGNIYFGYSPRGFLIHYSNKYLPEEFTRKVKEYYKKRGFAFIKINPEIAVAKLNKAVDALEEKVVIEPEKPTDPEKPSEKPTEKPTEKPAEKPTIKPEDKKDDTVKTGDSTMIAGMFALMAVSAIIYISLKRKKA